MYSMYWHLTDKDCGTGRREATGETSVVFWRLRGKTLLVLEEISSSSGGKGRCIHIAIVPPQWYLTDKDCGTGTEGEKSVVFWRPRGKTRGQFSFRWKRQIHPWCIVLPQWQLANKDCGTGTFMNSWETSVTGVLKTKRYTKSVQVYEADASRCIAHSAITVIFQS